MAQEKILYKPNPGFQTDALLSPADFVLTGGMAGPGKSWWLILNALFDYKMGKGNEPSRCYEFPKYTAVILRRNLTQTEQIKKDATPLYSSLGFKWTGQPHNRYRHPNGASIYVRHMQNEDDWLQFQGWEIHYLGFDELTQFTEGQVANVLPWMRSTVPGVRARFAGTTNPEGIGLDWVRDWWKIQCPCPIHKSTNPLFEKTMDLPEGKVAKTTWHFIPGNRKGSQIEKLDPAYEGKLALQCGGFDTPRFRALGQGCWEVTRGAFFGEFCDIHIIEDDWEFPHYSSWTGVLGHDYAISGEGDAFGGVYGKVSPNRDVVVEHEVYGWGKDPKQQTTELWPLYVQAAISFSGQDIFNQNQAGEIRDISGLFQQNGIIFHKASADRGIAVAASLIRTGLISTLQKRSGGCLYIRKRCRRLIADMQSMLTDPKDFTLWDKKHRIKVEGKNYHFDVFNAFRQMYCGTYSPELPKPKPKGMSKIREKTIEDLNKPKDESWNCYSPLS